MGNIPHATSKDFDLLVKHSSEPVVVDFYASWCPPCKMLAPILDRLAKEYEGRIRFIKVNTDEQPQLASQFQIRGVPTLILFHQGNVVDQIVGVPAEKAFRAKLDELAGATG
ncbi:MAG: thioredoxin [Pirellulaceae bacterium]|nr:MAG: thioredoxin [Pirellulaceae bacterium]